MQWIADESFQEIIDGTTTPEIAMDWGMIDFQEEEEDFDKRMIEKYGASEDDEEKLNVVYYRDYLASFEEEMPVNSDNEIKVVTVEGTIMG